MIVSPFVCAGPSFFTRITQLKRSPRFFSTAFPGCASLSQTYFLTERSKPVVGFTENTAGSVLLLPQLFVGSSLGLETVAVLVTLPVVAVTTTGTTISGYTCPAARTSERVQVIVEVTGAPLHDQPGAEIFPFGLTPRGKVSVTVVTFDVAAGPLLVTRMIYLS